MKASDFTPQVNMITLAHITDFTPSNVAKYPTTFCVVLGLWLFSAMLIKCLPEIENLPVLAQPRVFRDP